MKEATIIFVVAVVMGVGLCSADATIFTETIDLNVSQDPSFDTDGLAAQATFTLDTSDPAELMIKLINMSTGVPPGFDNSDQLLTGISWDFGQLGYNGDPMIIGGTVIIGPDGRSIDFDQIDLLDPQLGAGAYVSGEWGYGNMDGTGLLTNFVTATKSQATAFGGTNWDGPINIDGPQGGICTDPPWVSLGGLGAVADSVIITLTLDTSLANLNFLENGAVAEFGSDAAFLVPEPATVCLLGLGSLSLILRRRR